MLKYLGFYGLFQLGVVTLAIVAYVLWDKRYRRNHGSGVPVGFKKTEEVTIDPSNGKKFRVYFNSETGERFYHEEN